VSAGAAPSVSGGAFWHYVVGITARAKDRPPERAFW